MQESPSASMQLDVLSCKDPFSLRELFDIKCFLDYRDDPEESLDVNEVVKYVVLLYSKDSILNKKPMPPLDERRSKAAFMAGLDPEDQAVKDIVFDLMGPRLRTLILEYLIYQNQMIWSERCIIETQIQENQRIRFKPIQNKTASVVKKKRKKDEEEDEEPEDNREEDDKYILDASNKKYSLTDHFKKYYALLREYDAEIFGDHDNVKAVASKRKERTSLENMAQ